MRRRRATVEFTDGQAAAVLAALDSYLGAATEGESRAMFGSAQGINAALRAQAKLQRAFYGEGR
jgi:hypothetical protein